MKKKTLRNDSNIIEVESSHFTIDDSERFYSGYHAPATHWNGWSCPWMDFETVCKVFTDWNAENSIEYQYSLRIRSCEFEGKHYPSIAFKCDWELDAFYLFPMRLDEEGKPFYDLGGFWIWDSFQHLPVITK